MSSARASMALVAALAAAALTAAVAPASAATHACDFTCSVLISPQLAGQTQWVIVPGANGHARHARAGDHVVFRARSTQFTSEDFSPSWSTETVSYYCLPGPQRIRGFLCSHDGRDIAQEMEWRPDGYSTGLCAGVTAPAHAGERVTLQRCGQSPRTLWIGDDARALGDAEPLISGSSASADPLVLSVAATGSPARAEVLEPESTVGMLFDFVGPCDGLRHLPWWCPRP